KYDFLNHFLSLGIDKIWRKKAIKMLNEYKNANILDVATGTGDFAIAALKLNPKKVTGIDISNGMLKYGNIKLKKKNITKIELKYGDSENMEFTDKSFDAITVGFGVRNFENLEKGLQEFYRVLTDNGAAAILEFSKPKKFPVKQLYNFYFNNILPFLGKLFSKDKSAYTYLPESVKAFPEGAEFIKILKKTGFNKIIEKRLAFGIASIYLAKK
ncbi:MAG: bifunctional demethylmenaquinone methyltransferase/2-methoxy-6-polyprenyl-1,4-benzoquinol methylase UbiE, partial [Bacteroidetes bacterium]